MKENILVGAGLWIAGLTLTRDVSIAYIGVPLNILVPCVIGSWCSLSFGEGITPRSRLYSIFIACVFMGAALTAIVNAGLAHYLGLVMTDGLQAGMATFVSFVTRFLLPWIAETVNKGKWLSWIPFIRRGDKEQ